VDVLFGVSVKPKPHIQEQVRVRQYSQAFSSVEKKGVFEYGESDIRSGENVGRAY
jgi:hypothetical protein